MEQEEAVHERTTPFAVLPNELILCIAQSLDHAKDLVRLALAGRRFHDLILDKSPFVAFRAVAVRRAASLDVGEGPWLEAAAAEKGWLWLARAMEPLEPSGTGLGSSTCIIKPNTYLFRSTVSIGEHENHRLHGYALQVCASRQWSCGTFKDGLLHGTARRVNSDGSGYHGEWRAGMKHGRGIATSSNGDRHEGEWGHGCKLGPGVATTDNGRYRIMGTWKGDRLDGPSTRSCCPCDEEVRHLHHLHSPRLCHPFGYLAIEERSNGSLQGVTSSHYCNGDVLETRFYYGVQVQVVRFQMSPTCPDERFRGRVIKGCPWDCPSITRSDGSLTYTMTHPDPKRAPEAFELFVNYFKAGYLPVEDRDREDIAKLFSDAAAK